MTFPATPLDLRCELDLGGTQTDVSSYVYQRDGNTPPVSLTRGRADESGQANPGTAAWEWNNRSGNFSPKNPLSPYFGKLGRNTPVRWSVPAQHNYLRSESDDASGASCPDAAGLRLSGDLDVRLDLRLTDWTESALANNWGSLTASSWLLALGAKGAPEFVWSKDGTPTNFGAAQGTLTLPPGRIVLRATFQVSTGTVTFYTAAAGNIASGPWTQLGAAVVSGSTTLFAGTNGVSVNGPAANSGAAGFFGAAYALELLSGIGGTVVASPSFTGQAVGTTSFTDAQSNTWTLNGTAEISARDYRWHGQLSSQPPKWDVTGNDMAVKAAAGGPLRLISQGQAPLASPMRRAVSLQSGSLAPVAYWPGEDAAGATSLGSATGGPAMSFDASPAPTLATDSSFLCSAPLPTLGGTRMHGRVPAYSGASALVVRFLCKLGTLPASNSVLMRVLTTGTCREVSVRAYAGGGLGLSGWDATGANVFNTGPVAFAAGGQPLWYSIEVTPVSGGQQYSLVTFVPGASTGLAAPTFVSGGVHGNATDVWVNPLAFFTDTALGHIEVQAAWSALGGTLWQALNAWQGETAAARFARLAGENGWQVRIVGPPAVSAAMGAQAIDTLGNLLQACEDADRGQIYEPRQALALGYRTLGSMCGQAVKLPLDYTASEPGGAAGGGGDSGLDPTYDDQLTRNDVTLTRTNGAGPDGATYQYQLNDGSPMSITGVGDYADTKSVNVQTDAQLPNMAGWMVHVGTVDEARWPAIPLNLARPAMAALYFSALDADIGDLVQIADAPDLVVVDPVRQLAFQVTEQLGGKHYAMAFNGVPASPYTTIILDDPVYGRVDTDGSTLGTGVSSTATSLSVATDAGFPVWTQSAADFPFDIGVAGERMTVTNITGSTSPQAFTVTRSVNGVAKSQLAGADVRLWFPPILALS